MYTIYLFLIIVTCGYLGYALIPAFYSWLTLENVRRANQFSSNMEQMMEREKAKRMSRMFMFAPIIFAAAFWVFLPTDFKNVGIFFGIIAGFLFPRFYIKTLERKNREKFSDQLIDALMIMSSSFRGGLSLVQAIEAVVDEMPDPINKEFGTVLGENKMGVSLEQALNHLYNRMPSTAIQQMITAILLARETGGNLPIIFSRIVNNIREQKKIRQNLETLTLQGKIQGFVMTALPVGFGFIVYTTNRRIFQHMIESDVGRAMLIFCVVWWLIGAFLVWRISTFKEY